MAFGVIFWNYRKCLLCCFIAMALLVLTVHMEMGYTYERKKMMHFVITITSIFLSHYIIFQHIGLFLLAAIWSSKRGYYFGNRAVSRTTSLIHFPRKPMDILLLQLQNLKSELRWGREHHNERQNFTYLAITKDLGLFLTNFIVVMFLVIRSVDNYASYNTSLLTKIFSGRVLNDVDPNNLIDVNSVYDFLNKTFIQSINNGTDYNDEVIREPGWMDYEINKLITIIRIKQTRFARTVDTGQFEYAFDCSDYLPGWRPLSHHLYYVQKYKATYALWFCEYLEKWPVWFFAQQHKGRLYEYWNPKAYKTYLLRNPNSSITMLNYLKEYRWIDEATSALFIDFTLYKADSHIFSICSMMLEHTPFGSFIYTLKISSVTLQMDLSEGTYTDWFLFVLYALIWIKIVKSIVQKYWYERQFWGHVWNYVDICIIICSVLIVVFMQLRFYILSEVLYKFERRNKLLYADFRTPAIFDYIVSIFKGFLITLTTIRIWRLLQFARVFRLFTETLTIGASSFLWTLVSIFILLISITLAAQILTSSHLESFGHFLGSMTTVLSISFGYASPSETSALLAEQRFLPILLYVIQVLGIGIILTNMVTILMMMNFRNAHKLEEARRKQYPLTYGSYLWAEYSPGNRYLNTARALKMLKVRKMITDKLHEIDELKRWKHHFNKHNLRFKRRRFMDWKIVHRQKRHEIRIARIERLGNVLRLQTLILQRLVMVRMEQKDDDDSDEEFT